MKKGHFFILAMLILTGAGLLSCKKDSNPTGPSGQGTIGGVVTSAESGLPLDSILVRFFGGFNVQTFTNPTAFATTDAQGHWHLTVTVGNYTCVFTGTGIQQTVQNVSVVQGVDTSAVQSVPAPVAPGALRIVLNWGLHPYDLDSHLVTPGGQYDGTGDVNYYNRVVNYLTLSDTLAYLDHDDTNSYGPETVTIFNFPTGKFSYIVDNYSGSPSLSDSSHAIVRVYNSTGQIKSYNIPTNRPDTEEQWHVFNLNGATKTITDVDTVGTINSGAILKLHKKK